MLSTPNLETLTQALPENFAFYHLGEIATDQTQKISKQEILVKLNADPGRAALAYTLRGDIQAAVILMLEPGLDLSMYSEAGNIIASKLATRLADQFQIDVVLSPPARLEKPQLEYLVGASDEIAQKTYVHAHAGKDVQLEALIFIHAPANGSLT